MKKALYTILALTLVALTVFVGCAMDHENIIDKTSDSANGISNQSLSVETGQGEGQVVENHPSESQPSQHQTVENQPSEPKNPEEQKTVLTAAAVRTIALTHANVDDSKLRDYEMELERERGVTFYEISFESEDWEYEYEIEAYTGEILYREKERDR